MAVVLLGAFGPDCSLSISSSCTHIGLTLSCSDNPLPTVGTASTSQALFKYANPMVSPYIKPSKRRVQFVWPGQEKRRHQPYNWQALADNDIRILTLLPGQFKHDIHIRIDNIPLPETDISSGARLSRRELQKTLPPGRTVHESLDGRFIFIQGEEQEARLYQCTSWTHPDPESDRSLYEAPSYEPPGPTNHAFESFSYVCGSQDDPACAFVEGIDWYSIRNGLDRREHGGRTPALAL